MPDCNEYQEMCSALLDNTLSRKEKQALEAHLADCPDCRAYLDDLRAMKALWKELETPAPAGLHERIMGAIEAEEAAKVVPMPKKKIHKPVFTLAAAAAACLLLAVSGSFPGLMDQTAGGAADVASPRAMSAMDAPAAASANAMPEAGVAEGGIPAYDPETASQTADAPQIAAFSLPEDEGVGAPMLYTAPADSGKAGRMAEPQAEDAPELPALKIAPTELSEMLFANCFAVTGEGEIPVVEGMRLLVTEDGIAYYTLENNESTIAKAQQTLREAGFAVTRCETSPVTIEREAEEVLVMLMPAQTND